LRRYKKENRQGIAVPAHLLTSSPNNVAMKAAADYSDEEYMARKTTSFWYF
jgi:hypothetical protein